MKFYDLLVAIPGAILSGPLDTPVTGIVYDSRQVKPGSVFVAYRGFHSNGHQFIPQALAAGAQAVVYEDSRWDGQIGVTAARVSNARVVLGPLAAAFAGYPAQHLRVIGITGTDGKTTSTFLTSAALEGGPLVSGLMGTVDFKVAQRLWSNDTRQSTPEGPEVQQMLTHMVEAGCTHAVIESTSHALSRRWNRLAGCGFDVAVLTNITTEHLDFHGTFEQYRADKARLFEMLGHEFPSVGPRSSPLPHKLRKVAVVNADDPNHRYFLDAAPPHADRLTYAVDTAADIRAYDVRSSRNGLTFRVETPWGQATPQLKLTGDFNVHNSLAALTVALVEGVPLAAAVAALERVPGVRGRMERIEQGQPFTVLVDYAHTPGSFEKLMSLVRPLTTGKLIAVFGSAGERDREKRPMQGVIAGQYCDLVVVTDEDPRLEDRMTILREIAIGLEQSGKRQGQGYFLIPDRAAAIRTAFRMAQPEDIVLLLGKGHEGCIFYADHTLPWNEAAEARAALNELGFF